MTNIFLLSGRGQRFLDKGIDTPKPFIKIGNMPMFLHSVLSLPPADEAIFVVKSGFVSKVEDYLIEYKDRIGYPTRIIPVDKTTNGQATSCFLCDGFVNENSAVNISACDYGTLFDFNKLEKFRNGKLTDILVWTFSNNSAVAGNPEAYSYAQTQNGLHISEIFCKRTISSQPLLDPALIGTFTFRSWRVYRECYKSLIQQQIKVNGEFYIDSMINVAIQAKYSAETLQVSNLQCFGTPQDVALFNSSYNYITKFKL